jgi:hypothetical protein
MEKQCDNCKFWKEVVEVVDNPNMGPCRRRAPMSETTNPLSGAKNLNALWPQTKSNDWCGEWEAKVRKRADDI